MSRDPPIRIAPDEVAESPGNKQPEAVQPPSIVITHGDIAEDELASIFSSPVLARFIEFVQAGLPQDYLRQHPDLTQSQPTTAIKNALAKVSDPALKGHLQARLDVLKEHLKDRESKAAVGLDALALKGPAPKTAR